MEEDGVKKVGRKDRRMWDVRFAGTWDVKTIESATLARPMYVSGSAGNIMERNRMKKNGKETVCRLM
jgi:hypothetical protein